MRLAFGLTGDDEESIEAAAGAQMMAETDHHIGSMAAMMRSYIEALNESAK